MEKTAEIIPLTCTCCTLSCHMTLTVEDGQLKELKGNGCKMGEEFAGKELLLLE